MASESGCPIEMHKIDIEKCDEMYDAECTGEKFMPFHRAWYDHKTGQSPNSPREQVKYPIQREKATTSLFLFFFFHHHQRLVETLTGTLAKKKREDRVKQTFARLNSLNGRLTVLSACRNYYRTKRETSSSSS